ncbi:aspartoacylase [Oceanisphaera litoralis]|uniref:aspartoacylase n=1 Tax=Oceanisphaera litoralis TaxID=225144 RepID=UPI00195EA81D|nr:aspartoacylase [Oceanisphaera litoralis]MBM7454981.1 aspartoacylase [Oceanisphaera litoralis]
MKKITRVALVGGTHGNELSGIYLLKKWRDHNQFQRWPQLELSQTIANPRACEQSVRYIETDLNREFALDALQDDERVGYEQLLAKKLNRQFGPRGKSPIELMIDLHNTTSNMGACLMLLRKDAFNIGLGAYVKANMPEAVVFFQDELPEEKKRFLISVAQQGVTVEVGPQPNSVLQQETLELMERMTQHILDFVVCYNEGSLTSLPADFEAFQYTEDLVLPTDEQGQRLGMVAKRLEQRDFQPIEPGEVVMETFDGTPITWQGNYTAYPLFINEAAYHKSHAAMTLSRRVMIRCADYL